MHARRTAPTIDAMATHATIRVPPFPDWATTRLGVTEAEVRKGVVLVIRAVAGPSSHTTKGYLALHVLQTSGVRPTTKTRSKPLVSARDATSNSESSLAVMVRRRPSLWVLGKVGAAACSSHRISPVDVHWHWPLLPQIQASARAMDTSQIAKNMIEGGVTLPNLPRNPICLPKLAWGKVPVCKTKGLSLIGST